MTEEKKHFDVAHPGTTTPQHTSRPIIVGRSNVVEDPMVKPDVEQPAGEPAGKKSTLSHTSLGLTAPAANEASSNAGTEKTADSLPADAALESEKVPEEAKTADSKTPNQATVVPDKVQELIQSKAYELPISRPKSKTVMLPVFILLMIVLVAAVVYIAMLATGRL